MTQYLYQIEGKTKQIEKAWPLEERMNGVENLGVVDRGIWNQGVCAAATNGGKSILTEDTYYIHSNGKLVHNRYDLEGDSPKDISNPNLRKYIGERELKSMWGLLKNNYKKIGKYAVPIGLIIASLSPPGSSRRGLGEGLMFAPAIFALFERYAAYSGEGKARSRYRKWKKENVENKK